MCIHIQVSDLYTRPWISLSPRIGGDIANMVHADGGINADIVVDNVVLFQAYCQTMQKY